MKRIMTNGLEGLANALKTEMRKGFMNILVLYILRDEPCNGYQIQQRVKNITHGVWELPTGIITRNLTSLTNKGLVIMSRIVETGNRRSKEYDITEMGKDALELVVEDLKDVIKVMRALVFSFYGLDVDYEPDEMLW